MARIVYRIKYFPGGNGQGGNGQGWPVPGEIVRADQVEVRADGSLHFKRLLPERLVRSYAAGCWHSFCAMEEDPLSEEGEDDVGSEK